MADIRIDDTGRVVLPESKTLEYKVDLSSPDRVLESIDQVMAFFRRHAFLLSKFGESPRRRDVWSLPFDAL